MRNAVIPARLTGRVGLRTLCVVLLLAAVSVLGGAPGSHASGAQAVDTGGYRFADATCSDETQIYGGVEYCQGDNWTEGGSLWDPDYGGYGYRNCTDWVAYRLATNNDYAMPAMPAGRGDASYWGAFFAARGQAPSDTPTQGDIAWEPTGDHVAYVEKVSADGKSVTISEYNEGEYPPDPSFGGDGTYDMRVVATSAFKYIHVKDITPVAPKNLVADGGFETPRGVSAGSFDTFYAGSKMGPWNVIAGSVDLIDGLWKPAAGNQSLDVSGYEAGAISQTIPTVPGKSYLVQFALAANPDSGPEAKRLRVRFGATSVVFSASIGTHTRTSMGWKAERHLFKATNPSTTLAFISLVANSYGPAIDAVQVTQQ